MYYIDLAVTGISFGCMYAMMSVGLTLVYGLLRILHVAHAAVFALGAYVTVLVANATGSIALGFLAAIIVTPLFGMAIYRLLYEPLLKYRPDVPMIASVGLLVLMQDAFRIVFGEQGITFRRNAFAFTTFNFAGVTVSAVQIAIVVTAAVVFAGLHLFTTRTRIGDRLARHGIEAANRRELRRSIRSRSAISISRSARRWPRSPAGWSRC